MCGRRVLIVSPGLLPVPAVKGGAVETLIESLARQNEVHKKMKLTVISLWDREAALKAEKYKETEFIFVRQPLWRAAADTGIYSYIEFVKKDWRSMFFQQYYREKYYVQKVAKIMRDREFDLVVFENNFALLCALELWNNDIKYAGKYDFHQHSAVLDTEKNREHFVKCRRILAVSEYVRQDILKNYPEVKEEQVLTIKNGVNRKRFGLYGGSKKRALLRKKWNAENRVIFFYSGRLSPEKGVLEMIREFKKGIADFRGKICPPVLLIAGGCFSGRRLKNSYYRKVQQEIGEDGEWIRLLGYVPYEEMPDCYAAADVILLPTTVPDAAPLTLLEGMMSPAAVIASKMGGIPEYAGDGGAMLVSMDGSDPAVPTMAQAVSRVLEMPELIAKIGKAGQEHGRRFTCRRYYDDCVQAFREEKPVAFLGTGRYAHMALEYYGRSRAACFVNFNSDYKERTLLGLPVMDAEEYFRHAKEYLPVLISTYQNVIARRLAEHGIREYQYYSPAYVEAMEELKKYKNGVIAIYGSRNAEVFRKDLKSRTGISVRYLLEEPGDASGTDGGEVRLLKDVKDEVDVILIGDGTRHALLTARAMREKAARTVVINPFRQRRQFATDELVVNPYQNMEGRLSETQWNERQKNHGKQDEIDEFVAGVREQAPLFEMIELETVNRCNGSCQFCPVNYKLDPRPEKRMMQELFEKIILDLEALGYDRHVALFSNNEPFLDPEIEKRAAFARAHLPQAKLHLFTNGTLLTLERFLKIVPFLDELVIDNYSKKLELLATSREIMQYCEAHPELKKKVTIVIRDPEEVLTTRGGDAPNRREKVSYSGRRCALPFQQMVVRPDGKLSLCCNDPLGKETLGDLNEQTILEAWYSPAYQRVREELYQGRGVREHCRHCDTFDLY